MKINDIIKEELEILISEGLYDFGSVDIDITEQNYNEAMSLRKVSGYDKLGIGTFLSSIILWRVINSDELNKINNTNRVIGGNYSVKVETYQI